VALKDLFSVISSRNGYPSEKEKKTLEFNKQKLTGFWKVSGTAIA